MNLFYRKAEISAAVTHISCYNRCWKPLCCLIFFVETDTFYYRIICWIESSKEQRLFEVENFCNIINVFTVSIDPFDVFLLYKSIIFIKKICVW